MFVPRSLVDAYYLHPDMHVPYFYKMIYYGTCSVTGGRI